MRKERKKNSIKHKKSEGGGKQEEEEEAAFLLYGFMLLALLRNLCLWNRLESSLCGFLFCGCKTNPSVSWARMLAVDILRYKKTFFNVQQKANFYDDSFRALFCIAAVVERERTNEQMLCLPLWCQLSFNKERNFTKLS
jgi:hypothetical protein